jgi:hypothetical protein
MIKRADIKSIPDGVSTATPPDPDNYATIPLKALADKLRALNQQRLPLFRPKPDDSIRQVIHLSVIDAYLQQHPEPPSASPPPTPATLQTFLDDPEVKKQLAGSFDFVAVTGTLSDVQKAMTQQCEDVFVTQNGKPAEPVLGWITSDRLAEALKM